MENACIEPNLAELIGLRRLAGRGQPARRGATEHSAPATSPQRGRGMEYAESRPYSPGDDVRHMDWRVTARTGRAHSKIFQAERERISLVLADTAPALYFGTRARFKSVQAARAGALATWAALRAGDRPGALRATHSEPPCRPMGGQRGALHVLEALARWYARPPADDLGLAAGLLAARRLLHPGASLLVLADAGSFDAVGDASLAALAAHVELRVVLLTDALELDPPRAPLSFLGSGGRLRIDLSSGAERGRWRQAFSDRLDATRKRLRRLGARSLALRGDEPVESVLALFPSGKGQAA